MRKFGQARRKRREGEHQHSTYRIGVSSLAEEEDGVRERKRLEAEYGGLATEKNKRGKKEGGQRRKSGAVCEEDWAKGTLVCNGCLLGKVFCSIASN